MSVDEEEDSSSVDEEEDSSSVDEEEDSSSGDEEDIEDGNGHDADNSVHDSSTDSPDLASLYLGKPPTSAKASSKAPSSKASSKNPAAAADRIHLNTSASNLDFFVHNPRVMVKDGRKAAIITLQLPAQISEDLVTAHVNGGGRQITVEWKLDASWMVPQLIATSMNAVANTLVGETCQNYVNEHLECEILKKRLVFDIPFQAEERFSGKLLDSADSMTYSLVETMNGKKGYQMTLAVMEVRQDHQKKVTPGKTMMSLKTQAAKAESDRRNRESFEAWERREEYKREAEARANRNSKRGGPDE